MANVRIDVDYTIKDGQLMTFRAPCDCGVVSGIIVYYPELIDNEIVTMSKVFTFRDTHNNNLANINNLFVTGAFVRVLLDTVNDYAYLQNADTNSYIENQITELKAYTDEQLRVVTEAGVPKLAIYFYQQIAETDGQTVFNIPLSNFMKATDNVLVDSGRTRLSYVSDYVVNEDATITLKEGVPKGRTIDIIVLKNIPLGPEGSVIGSIIAPQSLPLDRLADSNIYITHDVTGVKYRLGLDNSGLYMIAQSE